MKIAIDILHPAHVHYFRNFYFSMKERGHEFLVTARNKDCATQLLDSYQIPFHRISESSKGRFHQAREFAFRTAAFIRLARRFQPDVLTGVMGPTIAVAGRILRRPVYVFYDTEIATLTNRFVFPLASKVVTPSCYQKRIGSHHVTYRGYQELAYLHPRRFIPDPDVVQNCGIDHEKPFAVVRFVGWWATHDRNESGLELAQKIALVKTLEKKMPVIVTSECDVPDEIRKNVYHGPPENIHHLLAFATLYVGESATMASECAVLGTPAIYIAKQGRGYTDDEAKYGLVFNYTNQDFDLALAKVIEISSNIDKFRETAAEGQRRLLAENIDVTEYMMKLFDTDFAPIETRSSTPSWVNV